MSGTNPVAAYKPSDCTSQTGTAYKSQIDANSVAAQRIVGRFAPHAASPPNMTLVLDPGNIFDGTTLTEIAAQTTAAITVPASHPRIDRVVIDNTSGTASVVTGTESTTPAPPAIPNGTSPVAQVILQTNTAAITNAIITDERNLSGLSTGGFGAQAPIASAATCDLGATLSRNVKITGTTAITSFGSSANTKNPIYLIEFAAALTLTAGAGMLLPTGASIATAAGDTAVAEYLGSGNWRVRSYHRADGSPTLAISGLLDEISSAPGSILYRGATGWVVLPPSADGDYVQQAGGVPTWAAPPSAGSMVALQTQDASASPYLNFLNIDGTYDEYVFEFSDIVGTANFGIRLSQDNGQTWIAAQNAYTVYYVNSAGNYSNNLSYGIIYSKFNYPMSGSAKLFLPAGTAKPKRLTVEAVDGYGSTLNFSTGAISQASTAAANAVQFFMTSGNITSGRITMYGLKHA